jgi:Fe2+ transport system protein FeoA
MNFNYGVILKKVSDLKIGDKAIVKKIIAKEPVKGRLSAMGIIKGANLKVLKHTLAKQTWDILANSTKVGLREEEAKNILVDDKNE